MAEPYVPDLFVGRTTSLARILYWANEENPVQRVLSVVGPPGVGKSYLLHRAYDRLQASGRVVFWIDLSRDPAIRGGCPDVLTMDGLRSWLKAAVQYARQSCPSVRDYEGSISPEAMIHTLATDLCDVCDSKPVLMVDGFEEINQQERDRLEWTVLEQFISRGCTRILIGQRDEFALNSPSLRWTEGKEILSVMDEKESDLQIKTRLEKWNAHPRHAGPIVNFPSADWLKNLREHNPLPPYDWNHPGLNTLLLERIVPRHQAGSEAYVSVDDLRQCILEVTGSISPLSSSQLDCLRAVATRLPPEWANEDLMDTLKIVIEDDNLSELFRRGIVFNIEGTPRYKVADGLRELVRAWQALL